VAAPHNPKEWDAFVSHASEEKDSVVEPLVRALETRGLRIWYDRTTLSVGDSLRRSIDEGLARSRKSHEHPSTGGDFLRGIA
jgi:hypothetical protein